MNDDPTRLCQALGPDVEYRVFPFEGTRWHRFVQADQYRHPGRPELVRFMRTIGSGYTIEVAFNDAMKWVLRRRELAA